MEAVIKGDLTRFFINNTYSLYLNSKYEDITRNKAGNEILYRIFE